MASENSKIIVEGYEFNPRRISAPLSTSTSSLHLRTMFNIVDKIGFVGCLVFSEEPVTVGGVIERTPARKVSRVTHPRAMLVEPRLRTQSQGFDAPTNAKPEFLFNPIHHSVILIVSSSLVISHADHMFQAAHQPPDRIFNRNPANRLLHLIPCRASLLS